MVSGARNKGSCGVRHHDDLVQEKVLFLQYSLLAVVPGKTGKRLVKPMVFRLACAFCRLRTALLLLDFDDDDSEGLRALLLR